MHSPGMDDHERVSFPPGTLRQWDRDVNTHAASDDEPNRVAFVGAGHPATRAEILAFVAENNARYAREHSGE